MDSELYKLVVACVPYSDFDAAKLLDYLYTDSDISYSKLSYFLSTQVFDKVMGIIKHLADHASVLKEFDRAELLHDKITDIRNFAQKLKNARCKQDIISEYTKVLMPLTRT